MKLNFNLNLELSQKLIMTPELRQAIEILQFNSLELSKFVQEELMVNPVIEMNNESDANQSFEKEAIILKKLESIDWKAVAQDYDHSRVKNIHRDVETREEFNLENMVAMEDNLTDFLLSQLQFAVLDSKYIPAGRYIIQNIDHNGYLKLDSSEIENRFKFTVDEVEDIIQTIQTFEPHGVCARDLAECLLIQVQMKGICDLLVIRIIDKHLNDLAYNRLKLIAKICGASEHDVQEAVDIIRCLEPKPGRLFSSLQDIKYVVPDVTVEKTEEGYIILVNDSTAPKLQISAFYQQMLSSNQESETTEYIHHKLNTALKLIKSIEQRRNTIYRVVQAILNFQKDFFDRGTIHLRTLNLKDIADEIGVHESTVSRAVNGKYMQCHRGLFEMKYFFQSGVNSTYGDGISSESIKIIIKELIDKEDANQPISDQDISNEINKIGIKISRRTIAKYRDELKIQSSSKRKRYE